VRSRGPVEIIYRFRVFSNAFVEQLKTLTPANGSAKALSQEFALLPGFLPFPWREYLIQPSGNELDCPRDGNQAHYTCKDIDAGFSEAFQIGTTRLNAIHTVAATAKMIPDAINKCGQSFCPSCTDFLLLRPVGRQDQKGRCQTQRINYDEDTDEDLDVLI
jgi:hypothetical protein